MEPAATFTKGASGFQALEHSQSAAAVTSLDEIVRCQGGPSLRVEYDFRGEKELEYVSIQTPIEIADTRVATGLGLWFRSEGPRFPIAFRIIDSSGETHQFGVTLGLSDAHGWQYGATLFSSHRNSWGGNGNGKLDDPCHVQLVVDRPQRGFRGTGSLWLGPLAYVGQRDVVDRLQVTGRDVPFGNLFRPGQPCELRAVVSGEGTVFWSVGDYWGAEIARGDGDACQAPTGREGFFTCRFDLREGADVVESRFFHYAVLRETGFSGNRFVGVCTHFRRGAYPLACLDLLKAYGVQQIRDEIPWRDVEVESKRYVLPDWAEAFLDRAHSLGFEPLLIYDYSNPHYDNNRYPNSADAIRGYAEYAVELTRQARGRVKRFEVWNEWVGGCGMGPGVRGSDKNGIHTPESYGPLLRMTYDAVKAAFPEVTVIGVGGEFGADCADNVAGMIRAAGPDKLDAFSIHPYHGAPPEQPSPGKGRTLVEEIRHNADRAAALGAPRKVFATEIGYATQTGAGGFSETEQARYSVRSLALLQSAGDVEGVYWYDFREDGVVADYNEHHFGVVRHQSHNCSPKPAAVAISVFARLTAGATCGPLYHDGARYWLIYQRPDGTQLLLAWTTEDTVRTLTVRGGMHQILDFMGNPMDIKPTFRLTQDVLYVEGGNLAVIP